MQILLANAKIMNDHSEVAPQSVPKFQTIANQLAAEMALCDIGTLAKELDCGRTLAAENWRRYQDFHVRGAMVRFILKNHITDAKELKAFCNEGFEYNPYLGEELFPHYVREL